MRNSPLADYSSIGDDKKSRAKNKQDRNMNQTNGLQTANAPPVVTPFPTNRLVRWSELREYLGISDAHMHTLSNAGQLPPFFRVGRTKFFDPSEITTWLASRRNVA
ncbi:AlpA family transcriptional regulator [Methylosinus sp. R-45379]|uniref:helix-turn-helix transcriptional regulator n=1 Tax=Methylosinus sp. R-45379 TaxID=980563 RepID=UPI0012EEA0D1|nr:helix-turn-helix domain-containing protein [Methylosinus sp. R-45379]